jgi:hypothetical protein
MGAGLRPFHASGPDLMGDMLAGIWEEIAARPTGPMAFRVYLQPLMATFFAVRDGLKDARHGSPPYFWALFTGGADRVQLIRDGWKSVGRVVILALAIDLVYQISVLGGLRPVEGIIVAALLAIGPYLLFRGLVNRLFRRF